MSEETVETPVHAENGGGLAEVGTGLRESVEALTHALEAAEAKAAADIAAAEARAAADVEQERKTRRRGTWYFFVALAADLVLSAVSIGLYVGVQDSLHQNYLTAQQQQATRVDLLCPLYETLLGVAEVPPPAPLPPAQLKVRSDAIAALKKGYTKAGC